MDKLEALQCPRGCSDQSFINYDDGGQWVECECGMRGPTAKGWQDAVTLWNERPLESALRLRVADLEAEVERLRSLISDFEDRVNPHDLYPGT